MNATALRSLTELLLDPTQPVSTIARTGVVVHLGVPIAEARRELLRQGATEIVVVDDDGRPVGLLRTEDLLATEVPPESSGSGWPIPEPREPAEPGTTLVRVDDLMQLVFVRMFEEATIAAVCAAMARRRTDLVVILAADGRLAGLLSAIEIVRWVAGSASSESGIPPSPSDAMALG